MRGRRPLWIGAIALVGFAVILLTRTAVQPADAVPKPATTSVAGPASPSTSTPLVRVPVATDRHLPPPVDPKEVDLRFNARGRKRFDSLTPERQADELAETLRDEAKALDPTLGDALRCHAFESLARRGAMSPAVAASMAQLLQSSGQAGVRELLSTAAKGRLEYVELVEALLSRLIADPHEVVRKRAAQSLADRLDDPRIREALERSRTSDPSPFVQDAIRRILEPAPRAGAKKN